MSPDLREILRRRRAEGSGPPFDDPYQLALVAEGGAMRGVIAGGMVQAIEEAGFAHCFDFLIGASAGACALAYLRAGQAAYGTRMFYEDINNRAFIDHRRPLKGRAVVDIDFLVDRVFRNVKPLNHARLAGPGPRLIVVATDVDRGEAAALEGFETLERVLNILRATTRMPFLSAGPVWIDGTRYLDGGMLDHVPLARARRLGATHLLAVLTRPPGSRLVTEPPSLENRLAAWLCAALYNGHLVVGMRREAARYRQTYALLGGKGPIIIKGAMHYGVTPSPDFRDVSRTEIRGTILREAAEHGFNQMRRFLDGDQH